MPLFHKPHTATVTQKTTVTASSEVTGYVDLVPTVAVQGQLTEKTPGQALEDFGFDLAFPAVWLCDLSDADDIQVGYKLTVNSRDYRVLLGPQRMDAETVTAHARYLCERFDD